MSAWRELGREFLIRLFDERVLTHPASGARRVQEAVRRGLLGARHYERAIAVAAAYLASPASGEHPLRDCPALWDLAAEMGQTLREDVRRHSSPTTTPQHFMFRSLPRLYELMADRLPGRLGRQWRGTLTDFVADGIDFLESKRGVWGKTGPHTGTGPNHLFRIAGQVAQVGRVLGDAEALRFARSCARALCRQQSPEGYFPEHSGATVGYEMVYADGLSDYVSATGDGQVRAALERLVDFIARAVYPDLTPLETIDQRNRGGRRRAGVHMAGCAWTPAGRALATGAIRGALGVIDSADVVALAAGLGPLALAVLQCPDGPAGVVPAQRPTHHDCFDGLAVIGRKAGWFHVLSGYHEPPQLYNPFQMDRTQNLSVYHDACGLIVGGGNDKFAPDAATIELMEGGEVFYFPALSAQASGSAGRGRLRMDYGCAAAELRTAVLSAKSLELSATLKTNFRQQRNRLNLQLPLDVGTLLKADGRTFTLDRHVQPLQVEPVRRLLTLPGAWTIEVPGGAELHWPHLPHACYGGRPNRSPLASAVAFLRIELDGAGGPRTVRFHVPARSESPLSKTGT